MKLDFITFIVSTKILTDYGIRRKRKTNIYLFVYSVEALVDKLISISG